jgi:hypothetical protein
MTIDADLFMTNPFRPPSTRNHGLPSETHQTRESKPGGIITTEITEDAEKASTADNLASRRKPQRGTKKHKKENGGAIFAVEELRAKPLFFVFLPVSCCAFEKPFSPREVLPLSSAGSESVASHGRGPGLHLPD